MVGPARFELATPRPPVWCANQAALRPDEALVAGGGASVTPVLRQAARAQPRRCARARSAATATRARAARSAPRARRGTRVPAGAVRRASLPVVRTAAAGAPAVPADGAGAGRGAGSGTGAAARGAIGAGGGS